MSWVCCLFLSSFFNLWRNFRNSKWINELLLNGLRLRLWNIKHNSTKGSWLCRIGAKTWIQWIKDCALLWLFIHYVQKLSWRFRACLVLIIETKWIIVFWCRFLRPIKVEVKWILYLFQRFFRLSKVKRIAVFSFSNCWCLRSFFDCFKEIFRLRLFIKLFSLFMYRFLLCLFYRIPTFAIAPVEMINRLWLWRRRRFLPPKLIRTCWLTCISWWRIIIGVIIPCRNSFLSESAFSSIQSVHVWKWHSVNSKFVFVPVHSDVKSMFPYCEWILKWNAKSKRQNPYSCHSKIVRPSLTIFFFPDSIESTNSMQWIWLSSESFHT